jgi:hypothetical protein
MGYSKKFTPEKYNSITKVVEAIQRLTPGQSTVIDCNSESDFVKTRYLVYDFLYQMNLKGKFRIKTLPNQLIINRLGFKFEPKVSIIGGFDQKKIERLIELWDEPEARPTLDGWVEGEELTPEEGEELWEHVKRIMS